MNPFKDFSRAKLQDFIDRANFNLQISNLELQRIDTQYSIDKRDKNEDTRIDPADLVDQLAIIEAQYALTKRNKQRAIAQVTENKNALQAAIDLIPA